jgi:hypothetical protein
MRGEERSGAEWERVGEGDFNPPQQKTNKQSPSCQYPLAVNQTAQLDGILSLNFCGYTYIHRSIHPSTHPIQDLIQR